MPSGNSPPSGNFTGNALLALCPVPQGTLTLTALREV